MTDESIHIVRDDPLAWLVLNRPEKLNAISGEMWRAIPDALASLERDNDVRVILFRGAGERAFSAGADIAELEERARATDTSAVEGGDTEGTLLAIEGCIKPTIAAIRGRCMGGGCAIALSTDMRVAAGDATFALTPARLGIGYPYSGIERAVRELGPAATRQLFLTAGHINASQARAIGLVQSIHEPEDLFAAATNLGRIIAANAPMTIRAVRESVRQSMLPDAERDSARAQHLMQACFDSEDYREGLRAFLERRAPEFRNR